MKYFVKVKFAPVPGIVDEPRVVKSRFTDRAEAFDFIAQMLAEGAASVTIRPEHVA